MSVFHVEAILKEHPELWGILGKRMIGSLSYAGVKRINPGVLSGRGFNAPHFIISHDGLLLAKVETGVVREMWSWLSKRAETVLDAVRRVGPENVWYIAHFDKGCDDVGAPCALYINKTPKEQTLAAMIDSMSQDTQKEVAEG